MNELLGNLWFLVFASTTIIAVAVALAFAWFMVRRTEAVTQFKQAMLARGLSVDEMERLLRPPASENDERHVGLLAERLSACSASGETIKSVLEAYQAADLSNKRLLFRAIWGVCAEGKMYDDQILGVVHGLSRTDGATGVIGQSSEFERAQQAPTTGGEWNVQRSMNQH